MTFNSKVKVIIKICLKMSVSLNAGHATLSLAPMLIVLLILCHCLTSWEGNTWFVTSLYLHCSSVPIKACIYNIRSIFLYIACINSH